ncbi:MAG: recombinase family protein [Cyanobacteriota bacterium]
MKIGYARVSTKDQNLDLQLDELKTAGCEKIYQDFGVSGSKTSRPELDNMLKNLRSGDVVVIWKLDRLGRSLKDLVTLVEGFNSQKIGLQSLHDPIDTTTAQGKLIFNIFASLAEFEKDVIRERTKAGLESARSRGRVGGRPKGLSPEAEKKAKTAKTLYESQQHSIKDICSQLSISKKTLYSYLRHQNVTISSYQSTNPSIINLPKERARREEKAIDLSDNLHYSKIDFLLRPKGKKNFNELDNLFIIEIEEKVFSKHKMEVIQKNDEFVQYHISLPYIFTELQEATTRIEEFILKSAKNKNIKIQVFFFPVD